MKKQSGQSLIEFAVGAASLTLLMLGSITLAGYQQVQRRTTLAAREVAFENAWLQDDDPGSLQGVAELQLQEPGLTASGDHPYVSQSGVAVAVRQQRAPGLAGTAAHAMLDPLQVAGGFLNGNFDLPAGRYIAGTVTVDIDPRPGMPQPFRGLSLQFKQPFALQEDAWNASGARHVRSRAHGLVPSTALSGLQSIWRPLLSPLALLEPSLEDLCLGLIEPDRIPEDRLGAGRTPLPKGCP
ncbi:MAG: TadE family protein [Steroidobacteraceae bacterium]